MAAATSIRFDATRFRVPDSLVGLGSVVAAHLAVGWLLLNNVSAPQAVPPRVLQVSLIMADAVAPRIEPALALTPPAPATPAKPQPRPARLRPAPAPPMLTVKQPRPVPVRAGQSPLAATPKATDSTSNPSPRPIPKASQALAAAPSAVTQPRFDAAYLNNPAPVYPLLSRRLGEQGRVLLRVYVDPAGSPTRVELRQSCGHPRLDAVAQDAVWRWRFVPARQGEDTVGAWVLVPISFSLRS